MTAAGADDALATLAIALVVAEGQCVRGLPSFQLLPRRRTGRGQAALAASTWLMIHPLVLGSGRGLFVAEALTSGHFAWPQAGSGRRAARRDPHRSGCRVARWRSADVRPPREHTGCPRESEGRQRCGCHASALPRANVVDQVGDRGSSPLRGDSRTLAQRSVIAPQPMSAFQTHGWTSIRKRPAPEDDPFAVELGGGLLIDHTVT